MKLTQKKVTTGATEVILVTGGFIAEGFIAEKTVNMLPAQIARFQGPIHMVAGVIGAAMSRDPYVKAAAKGLATGGAIRTAKTFAPDGIRSSLSLNGIGTADEEFILEDPGREYIEEFIDDRTPALALGNGPVNLALG